MGFRASHLRYLARWIINNRSKPWREVLPELERTDAMRWRFQVGSGRRKWRRPPQQFAFMPDGTRLPIKPGEVVKAGDMLAIEDGQVVVAKKAEPTGFVWPGGDTAIIDAGQLR